MGTRIPCWAIANGFLGGWVDDRVMCRRGRCRCREAQRARKGAAVEVDSRLDVPDIATKIPHERDAVAQFHSRAAAQRALARTRAKSEGFARQPADRMREVSAAGAGETAAAVVRCLDNKGGFCWASRRQRTDAAESGTGRCTAERPSCWPRSPVRVERVKDLVTRGELGLKELRHLGKTLGARDTSQGGSEV
jgi:hypothetical protein